MNLQIRTLHGYIPWSRSCNVDRAVHDEVGVYLTTQAPLKAREAPSLCMFE